MWARISRFPTRKGSFLHGTAVCKYPAWAYMLGYNDLKDPSVSGFFRFLAKVGDNGMKMQIVKIGFGDKL